MIFYQLFFSSFPPPPNLLNILKNAEDNFLENSVEKPVLSIIVEENTISICDNGNGIPDNIIEHIFEPYFSTKDEKTGTGLGLYMSKMIIEKHLNGAIEVYNSDEGACFTVKLLKQGYIESEPF